MFTTDDPFNSFCEMGTLSCLASSSENKSPSTDPVTGCLSAFIGAFIGIVICGIGLFLLSLFSSCSTGRESTNTTQHHIETWVQHLDSVVKVYSVTRNDSAWHETILHQFQALHERNDTSHTLVVDSAGRVIKETLIIRTEKESASETERNEREVIMHQLYVMDSCLAVMQQKMEHTDSLLQKEKKTEIKEVEKKMSSWQLTQIWLGRLLLVALAIAAVVWAVKKRSWWLRLFHS